MALPGPLVVVALGGNALMERDQRPDAGPQVRKVLDAVEALAPLADGHRLVITHGNGPQVGMLAIESADDRSLASPYPLDALVAETQGLIGYWIVQALRNALPGREVAGLLTQVVVDRRDPAFAHPTKFIGPVYDEERAGGLAPRRGWTMARDGWGWRRVVASPPPVEIVELPLIGRLVSDGTVVVCGGGGGIPVARQRDGSLQGEVAVIDKDLTSCLLAVALGADALLLLTDVAAVSTDITDPAAPTIGSTTPTELRGLHLPAGSMGPKVEAACRFVEQTGGTAGIGALADAAAVLAGTAGTVVRPGRSQP